MPARLKSFELHGYKTFASRSEFQFSDGITAIVGPNGSGKSNIADALRWVLGEQSYGLLRGKKTEDMIFSGSENRPRAGMASATIVFDNSDGWLPIDFVEVGITRRAYRDGENEYLLNGQRVRLKDVSEVLAKSGLAERTYTIIGQGLVDAALALRAEERRRLFEEAAGIGLHRSRREEALKRLESTHRNLERVHDILAELQPRLRSLERQAKRALDYDQMKEDLKLVLREWYGYHWHKAQSDLVDAQVAAKSQEEILAQVQSSQQNLDVKINEYRIRIYTLREELATWHKELTNLHQRRETLSREQAVSSERSRLLLLQLEQMARERTKKEEEVGIQRDHLVAANQELSQLELELSESQQSAKESADRVIARQKERSVIEEKIHSLNQILAKLTTRSTQQNVLVTEKEAHIRRLHDLDEKTQREIISLENVFSSAKEKVNALNTELNEKTKNAVAIQGEIQKVQVRLNTLELERKDINDRVSAQKTRMAQLEAERNVLEEAEKNLTGHDEGARILIKAMQENKIGGAIGSLGSRLIVPEEYETAIAAILGEYVDSLVVESVGQTDIALDLMVNETTRGSIFPLDAVIPEKPLDLDALNHTINKENILGVASQLVRAETKIHPVVELLFGRAIIVRDRKTARTLLASSSLRDEPGVRVVTLRGEMYVIGGPIITGASGKGLLSRPRQQRELKAIYEQAKANLDDYQQQFDKVNRGIGELQVHLKDTENKYRLAMELQKSASDIFHQQEIEVEKIQRNLEWQRDQKIKYLQDIDQENAALTSIKTEILRIQQDTAEAKVGLESLNGELDELPLDEIQSQNAYWKTNVAVIEQALRSSRDRIRDRVRRIKQEEDNLSEMEVRSGQLEADINNINSNIGSSSNEETEIARKIEELGKIVDPLEDQLTALEKDNASLLTTDSESRQQLRAAEQRYTQVKINLAHHQESFESLRRHIEDDFGLVAFEYTDSVSGPKPLPLDGMVEELPKVGEVSAELEETIRQKKALIRRMGAINPEARLEFQEVKERFEFLSSQVEDLSKAEADIKEVIAELDALMEREFKRTFEAVALEFKQIFTRLFGGGSARLTLTDPDNLTETGIDIEAKLPGRREQGLSLLSGGERSLTATALVFSLLRVAPTPFCILDEVDAMLDEANVSRFRDLLTELSEKTQFIIITHNRNTVQAASIIYGVTMGRDSVSQVISLKMDELGEEFGV